jgi:hypothetical protein
MLLYARCSGSALMQRIVCAGVHDQSSRSHALLRIYVQRHDLHSSSGDVEGTLTLVDLAGSEHRIDSM